MAADPRLARQAYPGLSGIADPEIAAVLRLLFDRVASIQGREGDHPTFWQDLVLSGFRATSLGDPVADQDAVTLSYLKQHYSPEVMQFQLSAGGSSPLPLYGLLGLPQAAYYGTHAERLNLSPDSVSLGSIFYETDRAAIYQAQASGGAQLWQFVLCRPLRTATALPTDLGTVDAGFTWFDQVAGVTYRWSGGAWNYYLGSLVDTFANRPDPALADRGFLFIASDRNYHVWRKGATAWVHLIGVGGPMYGVLANITTGLTADDAGYRYWASDYDRLYWWNGAAWMDGVGQPARQQIVFFKTAPGAGWALCDGSAATISTATGGTDAFTTPDLITAKRFLRANSSSGGTGGSATTHTHQIDPPDTASSGPDPSAIVSTGQRFAVGAVDYVVDPGHHHDVDIAAFTSGAPSGASGVDALPPYYDALPYIRL